MRSNPGKYHIVWVFPEFLTRTLSSATWLDTTHELRKLGWQVTLLVAGPSDLHNIRGVKVHCIPKPNIYLFGQLYFHLISLKFMRKQWKSIDVILFHQISAGWFFPINFIKRLNGQRKPLLVMDTRSLPMETNSLRDRVRERYYNFMNILANRFADGQTAITTHIAYILQIPSDKLWGTWPSGVDCEKFSAAIGMRIWPSSNSPVQLIYIGVLSHERNLIQLCEALDLANSEGMSFKLSLVGDGPARSNLEDIAESSQGKVQIIPPVPHNSVPELLAEAHVGVLPFPDEEKFRVSSPIKLFEYMAAGLPVLVTRIKSHTDVISIGDYAFWAEDATIEGLYQALQGVWQSRVSLHVIGQHAAQDSKSWSWNESAKKLSTALLQGITSNHQYC